MKYQLVLLVALSIFSNSKGFVLLDDFDKEIPMDEPYMVENLILPTDPTLIEKDELQDTPDREDQTFSELFEKYDQTYNTNNNDGSNGAIKSDVVEILQTIIHEVKEGKNLKDPMALMNTEAISLNNDSMKRHHQELSFGYPLSITGNHRDAFDELKFLLDSKKDNTEYENINLETIKSEALQEVNEPKQNAIIGETSTALPGIIQNFYTSIMGSIDRFNDSQLEKEKKFRRNLKGDLATNELNEISSEKNLSQSEELPSKKSATIETIDQILDPEIRKTLKAELEHASVSEASNLEAVHFSQNYEKIVSITTEATVEKHNIELTQDFVSVTPEILSDIEKSEQVVLDIVEKIIYSSENQETSIKVTTPSSLLFENMDFDPIEIIPKDRLTILRTVVQSVENSNEQFIGFPPNEDMITEADETTLPDQYSETEIRSTTESVKDLVKETLEIIAVLGKSTHSETSLPNSFENNVDITTETGIKEEETTVVSESTEIVENSPRFIDNEHVTSNPLTTFGLQDTTEIWEVNTKISVSFASAEDNKLIKSVLQDLTNIESRNIFESTQESVSELEFSKINSSDESSEERFSKEKKTREYEKSRLEKLLNSEIKENSSESFEKQKGSKSSESIENSNENNFQDKILNDFDNVPTTFGPSVETQSKSDEVFEEIFYYAKDHDVRKKDNVDLISFENEINGIAEYIDQKVQTLETLPIETERRNVDIISKSIVPEDFVYGVVITGPKLVTVQPPVADFRSVSNNDIQTFTETEEEVQVLSTLVEGIELTNEMSKSIENFRQTMDETASIPETHNEIISSKNTRESVEVGMDHLRTQDRLDGSNNPNETRYFTNFWTFGSLLMLVGLVCVLRQRIKLILNFANQLHVTDIPV